MGEAFDVIASAPRIDGVADTAFELKKDLGVSGDACAKVGGKGKGFVEGVGVEGLGVSVCGGQCFHASAGHIVEGILGSEGPPRGLAMGAQRHRSRILGRKGFE